jgi:hypothetical protein
MAMTNEALKRAKEIDAEIRELENHLSFFLDALSADKFIRVLYLSNSSSNSYLTNTDALIAHTKSSSRVYLTLMKSSIENRILVLKSELSNL